MKSGQEQGIDSASGTHSFDAWQTISKDLTRDAKTFKQQKHS
jgi:hypothetical protein